jgi:hypothetical protein
MKLAAVFLIPIYTMSLLQYCRYRFLCYLSQGNETVFLGKVICCCGEFDFPLLVVCVSLIKRSFMCSCYIGFGAWLYLFRQVF